MRGVITRVQVLAHPIVILEGFGTRVLLRAIFASAEETFLEIVTRCAEDDAHAGMDELGLDQTVRRYVNLERRLSELYRALAQHFREDPQASRLFRTLSGHEEGHAIVLSRVRRELRRGRLWKVSRELHLADVSAFESTLARYEEEVRQGVPLARALEIAERVEGSEVNVVFDSLSGCVDMRSRARFERFFVLTEHHLAYCREEVQALRTRDGLGSRPST